MSEDKFDCRCKQLAIKDAEIADITQRKDKYFLEMCEVIEKNEKLLEEIAARDLMIKELREALTKISTFPRYEMPGDIAREALAKSEHIEALTPVVTTDETGRAVCVSMQNEEGQMKRIIWEVDSEHPNSRALDKMLLEAEIAVLKESTGSIANIRMIVERETKLAELNKE